MVQFAGNGWKNGRKSVENHRVARAGQNGSGRSPVSLSPSFPLFSFPGWLVSSSSLSDWLLSLSLLQIGQFCPIPLLLLFSLLRCPQAAFFCFLFFFLFFFYFLFLKNQSQPSISSSFNLGHPNGTQDFIIKLRNYPNFKH